MCKELVLNFCKYRTLRLKQMHIECLFKLRYALFESGSFERVEEFRYLGTTLTNQNSLQQEIKSRLKSGDACSQSVQDRLSCSLLSKNLKIKIYRTTVLPVVLYGCETWSLTMRGERRLKLLKNWVLSRIFGP